MRRYKELKGLKKGISFNEILKVLKNVTKVTIIVKFLL